jgi:pSer/pThr/pTyr-binding forkhead associated (FHA) protein
MNRPDVDAKLAYLAVPDPVDPGRERRIPVVADRLVIGRGAGSDLPLQDPYVSRAHAALTRHQGAVYIEDLGSSGGTYVAGERLVAPRQLRDGDVITCATVRLQFHDPSGRRPEDPPTRAMPSGPLDRDAVTSVGPVSSVSYGIEHQHAGSINNVARDQYVQHVIQQRESFLAQIAATRTKASWLSWLGLALLIGGIAAYYVFFAQAFGSGLGWIKNLPTTTDSGNGPVLPDHPFGPEVAGIPVMLIALGGAGLGGLLLVIGIVLHIVVTARRRRVDRDYALPGPWTS